MNAVKNTLISTVSVGALFAVLGTTPAAAIPIDFTWNPAGSSPAISTAGAFSPQFSSASLTVDDWARINTSNPSDVLEDGVLAVTQINAITGGYGFNGAINGNATLATGGASPYQLYIVYNTVSSLITDTFSSISYTLYGVADQFTTTGGCTFGVTGAGGATATCPGGDTPVALASGHLAPQGLNSVSIEGSSPTIDVSANADTTITAKPGESGFFVSPSNLALFDFQNAFSNTTGEVSTYNVSSTNNGYLVTQGSGSLTMVTAIPEPQTLAMFGFGLIGLGWLVKRRAKKS